MTVTVDDAADPLIAVASLYDKLLIFTQTRIYVVYGDGPAISGAGDDLTTPQRVPSPSGCIDPRSIVQRAHGRHVSGNHGPDAHRPGPQRDVHRQEHRRGALGPYPTCVSADWCEDSSTVRFGFTGDDREDSRATSGVVALFDVRRSRWAVHQLTNAQLDGSTLPDGAPISAATWHPSIGYVAGYNVEFGTQALIAREAVTTDPTPWLDYGEYFVALSVQMAPLHAGPDLQGWDRVRRARVLGQYYDAHSLTVDVGYDYEDAAETHSYTSAQIASLVVGSREQVRIIPARGKSEAIQLTIATAAPTSPQVVGSGRGAGFTGVSLEIHQKKGRLQEPRRGAKT